MRIRWRGFEMPTSVSKVEETSSQTYSEFVAEPFERGYGTTIGNSLRRVLISSILGSAVRSIRIKGANNEFASMEGILEDVTQIILNVKKLRMRSHSDEVITIRVEKKGIGAVTAADIVPHQDIEVINQSLVLANVTDEKAEFSMEMDIGTGRGFVAAVNQDITVGPVGTIAIDAIYSPIVRCVFAITPARVGKRTDFERLSLKIWTDGSISPDIALVESTNILRKHLNPFVKYFEIGQELERASVALSIDGDSERTSLLSKPLSALELSVRSENALRCSGIKTVSELVQISEIDLSGLSNLGKVSQKEIKKKLADCGLALGMSSDGETINLAALDLLEEASSEEAATTEA